MGLPVPPFLRKKCYRTLIARILKEAHKRWKQRNTQLLQSGDLMDHEWTPSTHTHKLPPSSPRKRKRDIQWFTTRLIETRMQHKLHDYTHKLTQKLTQYTLQSDTDPGEDSGGTSLIKEVGILEEEAIVGRYRAGQGVSWEWGQWGCEDNGSGKEGRRG